MKGISEPISPYPDGQWGVYKAPYRTRLTSRIGESEYDVRVELPDGGLLQWRVVSLGYYDRATGEFAIIESARSVELQNGSNVAIYPGIFTGIDYRVVHTNTGVRQEFVVSQARERELPVPSAYGLTEAELAIRFQVSGDSEWPDLLPFRNKREYVSLDERDGLLLIGKPSDAAALAQESDLVLETTLSTRPDKVSERGLRFDLKASGVPKHATILSARVLGDGMNREVKEQAQHWLAEPESNRGFAGLQQTQSTTTSQAQMVVEWVDNTSMVYYLKDHLGSVRATVNEVGAVVSHDDYDPWGLTLAGRSMATQANLPNKFTGKERDRDFGLDWDYFGARFYDAEVARFVAVDPLTEKHPDFTPYHYVLYNPLILIDPDGKQVRYNIGVKYDPKGLKQIGQELDEARFRAASLAAQGQIGTAAKTLLGGYLHAGLDLIDVFSSPATDIGPGAVLGVVDDALKAGKAIKVAKTTGDFDKRTKIGKALAKRAESLTTGTKDLRGDIAEAEIAKEFLDKAAGSLTVTGLADFAETALKQDKVRATLEKVGKPITRLIEKVNDKIDDLRFKKKE